MVTKRSAPLYRRGAERSALLQSRDSNYYGINQPEAFEKLVQVSVRTKVELRNSHP